MTSPELSKLSSDPETREIADILRRPRELDEHDLRDQRNKTVAVLVQQSISRIGERFPED